ncbi:MAG: GtrA family protein [Bacilli bacterium]
MLNFLKKFLTRNFIVFCIIGGINTLIHWGVYLLIFHYSILIANTIAFVIASFFSYWANATFTYREKTTSKTFFLSLLTFLAKLGLSDGLAYVFELWFKAMDWPILLKVIPLFVTVILLPLQFLVFNRIFVNSKTAQSKA